MLRILSLTDPVRPSRASSSRLMFPTRWSRAAQLIGESPSLKFWIGARISSWREVDWLHGRHGVGSWPLNNRLGVCSAFRVGVDSELCAKSRRLTFGRLGPGIIPRLTFGRLGPGTWSGRLLNLKYIWMKWANKKRKNLNWNYYYNTSDYDVV